MSKKRISSVEADNGEDYREAQPIHPPKPALKLDYGDTLEDVMIIIEKIREKVKEKLRLSLEGNALHWAILEDMSKKLKQIDRMAYGISEIATFVAEHN